MEEKTIIEIQDKIEGRNPVMEALRSGREIDKILVRKSETKTSLTRLVHLAKKNGVVVMEVEKQKLDSISETGNHQGVVAYVAVQSYISVEDIFDIAREKNEPAFIIICDKITDPHNLGSIIRSANCFGAHGIIIPKRNSVGLTAIVAKSSAGAVEYTRVAKVANISQTIELLKKQGVWVVGADMDGDRELYNADMKGAIAIVVGSEGEGISRLVKEKCDFLVNIPMLGEINSLNASVASSVMMYEVMKQRNLNKD